MTAPLMVDPVDHWLDLTVSRPRKPLLDEMMSAYDCALHAPTDPGHRRAAWIGVGTGYAVAFGFVTREALERARRVPGALTVHPDDFHPSPLNDEETAWASGVLWGYSLGTSEHPDADTCVTCGQRIVTGVDDCESCPDGLFCPFDCRATFHNTGPSICAMEGES